MQLQAFLILSSFLLSGLTRRFTDGRYVLTLHVVTRPRSDESPLHFILKRSVTLTTGEERKPTRCNNIDGLLSIMDVGYWQCLNMFRASLCPSSGVKTTCYCIYCIYCIIDNKPSILLHLVGFLSSRFTHDARSQEHKASFYKYCPGTFGYTLVCWISEKL